MSENFNSNVEALFGKLENFVSSKTVVGEPIYIGGVILLPLVDVNFGMAAASMDKETDKNDLGGGGIGAKITPSAVIVVHEGNVQLVNVKNQESINKLIDLVPGVLSKFNFANFKDKNKNDLKNDVENKEPKL